MATISNDFARFTIVNVDPQSPSRGPFIVSQRGTDPEDPTVVERTFLLTNQGDWVDWSLIFAIPGGLADEVLFASAQEMVRIIEGVTGKARVRRLNVDPRDSLAKIAEIEAAGGLRVAIKYLLDKRRQANEDMPE